MRSRDTSIEAERVQRDLIRRMSGAERVRIAVEMSDAAREVSLAGIRARNPAWSETRARRALLELLYGTELVERAWGPATDS